MLFHAITTETHHGVEGSMSCDIQTRHAYEVRVLLPAGVTIGNMERYIRSAIQTMCGSLAPDDPLFDLNKKRVKVVYKGICPNGIPS